MTEIRSYSQTDDWQIHNAIWEGKLKRQVEFLADTLCHGRETGTQGGAEAAFYIIRNFKYSKLLPIDGSFAKHVFAGHGMVGHNIIGMLPGSKKNPSDSYIIVGAHYDHLGTIKNTFYPGADSNASGVVAIMNLANMFSTMKTLGKTYRSNIIFVAFDGREMSHAGSETLWRMIENGYMHDPVSGKTITKEKIKLMVNIDQIGSSLSPLRSGREDYLIMLGEHSLRRTDKGLLSMCNRMYGTNLEISHTYYGSENFTKVFYTLSDQKVFVNNKIPTVLFTSGITMNNNKTTDNADSLNYTVMMRRVILIFHWIESML